MDSVAQALAESWKPPAREPIYEWARKNLYLPNSYAIQGPFHVERSLYLKKPLEMLQSADVRRVTLYKAVQTGGSLVSEVWVSWLIENYPGPTMWNFQTDEDAKEAAEQRINPLFERCPAVSNKIPPNRFQRMKTAIYFYHMWLLMQGCGLSNIQSKSVQNLINDEIWLWPPGNHGQAVKRVTAFSKVSKILDISQGGEKNDEMDNSYQNGSCEEWGFKCPKCSNLQPYKWEQVKWDKNDETCPNGIWDFNKLRLTIRYQCQWCEYSFTDTPQERRAMNDSGEYIVMNPNHDPAHYSCRWNALASDAISWFTLVSEWINSNRMLKLGSVSQLKEFIQKRLAEPWDEEKFQIHETIDIKTSSYSMAETDAATKWGDFRFFTIDVQAREFWGVIRDWKKTGESRLVWAGTIATEGEIEMLQQKYSVNPWDIFKDSGFDTTRVYLACLKHGWVPLKGDDREKFFHSRPGRKPVAKVFSEPIKIDTGIGTVKQGDRRGFIKLFLWSNPSVKDVLQRLMSGQGASWEIPADIFPEYHKHLSAEVKKEVKDRTTGRLKYIWVRIRKDNHLFDCEAMQIVAACMERILGTQEQTEEKEKSGVNRDD
jgi:phage terminase large subunit GpA-like protein